MELAQFDFLDSDDYLVGQIISQTPTWTTLIAVDQAGNWGGVEFIKNSAVKNQAQTKDLAFFKYLEQNDQIKDVFNLADQNQAFLKQNFTQLEDVLAYLVKNKSYVSLRTTSGNELSGLVEKTNCDELVLREINDDYLLNEFSTLIPLTQIVEVSINNIDNRLFSKWQNFEQAANKGLISFYPDYESDERFTNHLVGKIIKEYDDCALVQGINEIGQLTSISLVNYDQIVHFETDSVELAFLSFAVDYQKKNHSYDPQNLLDKVQDIEVKNNFADTLVAYQDKLIEISSVDYDAGDWGKIIKLDKTSFSFKVLDDYQFTETISFDYEELDSIDFFNSNLEVLKTYLNQ